MRKMGVPFARRVVCMTDRCKTIGEVEGGNKRVITKGAAKARSAIRRRHSTSFYRNSRGEAAGEEIKAVLQRGIYVSKGMVTDHASPCKGFIVRHGDGACVPVLSF
jgi:hypothetical protein